MIAIKDEVLNDLVVVKRSGQRGCFNPLKIAIAIKNAFDSVDNNYTNKDTNVVYGDVLKFITSNYQDRKTINVEDVQNIIEDLAAFHRRADDVGIREKLLIGIGIDDDDAALGRTFLADFPIDG